MLIELEEFLLWVTLLSVQLSGSNGCAACKALSMQTVRVQQCPWFGDRSIPETQMQP